MVRVHCEAELASPGPPKPMALSGGAIGNVAPPAAHGAVPSPRQLAWHELELYAFLHFTVNTFTNQEWGYGDESPTLFLPTAFDAEQIVRTVSEAGMTALILTCRHHDGFCLWPSKFTEHSVKNSRWEDGRGDVVRSISEACAQYGLRFGVYLSPWDRHHSEYGRPAYIDYFKNQLRELLTGYGRIFEIWFDGANGGDGYYGGARTRRRIDRASYYRWDEIWALSRELQPDAMLFSDVGPDIRWVGNEKGYAGDPCWATYAPRGPDGKTAAPGQIVVADAARGHRGASAWIPAEVDVSIRPGWFFHERENTKVRTPSNLLNIYYESVGRGAALLLNLPPDPRGRIHDLDVEALRGFRRALDATFSTNLARTARISASNVRGGSERYHPLRMLDGDPATYYCTDDHVTTPEVTLEFASPVTFNVVNLREFLPLGLRVDEWELECFSRNRFERFAKGIGIGARKLCRGAPIRTDRVRLRVKAAAACPALRELGLYLEPEPPHPIVALARRLGLR